LDTALCNFNSILCDLFFFFSLFYHFILEVEKPTPTKSPILSYLSQIQQQQNIDSALGAELERKRMAKSVPQRRVLGGDCGDCSRAAKKQRQSLDVSLNGLKTRTTFTYSVAKNKQGQDVIILGDSDDDNEEQRRKSDSTTTIPTIADQILNTKPRFSSDEETAYKKNEGEEEELMVEGSVPLSSAQSSPLPACCVLCCKRPPNLAMALPCNHCYCRSCVLEVLGHTQQSSSQRTEALCPECQRPFTFADVKRVHYVWSSMKK